jgi:hypothetical protein
MPSIDKPESFQRWQREFRKAAKADQYAVLRDHLGRLDLPDKPESLLEGTIHVVLACLAYAGLDGQPSGGFLGMQKYDPGEAADARYAVTFDLHGKAFARVLTPSSLAVLDFADLYGHPWQRYKRCGYGRFWISRTDGRNLTRKELVRLEREVTDDLRFDYSEDEVDIGFDDASTKGSLWVTVQDCPEAD